MKLQVVFATLFAGAAFGGTIPVTGSGSFALDNFMDGNGFINLSGSNATDSVSFAGNIAFGNAPPTFINVSSLHWAPLQIYSATIDGVTSHLWSVSLDSGLGSIELFDPAGDVLASQDLSGFINITSYWEDGPRFLPDGLMNDEWEASGTFTIGPTNNAAPASSVPETGSAMLVGLGMLATLGRRFVIT
jgi:hypothetical protein